MNPFSTDPPAHNMTRSMTNVVTVNGEPVSPLFFNAIASVHLDPDARQEGYTAMRDALRLGFSLEVALHQEYALSVSVGNYSRAAGAVMFITSTLEKYEANGTSWTLDAGLDRLLATVINLPAALRRSSLALLPQRLEALAARIMCSLIIDINKAAPANFEDGKVPEKSGSYPVRHRVDEGTPGSAHTSKRQKKSIPAAQHGAVIRN